MSRQFNDIRIVSLDGDRTAQSPSAPGLRLMYLKLSEHPPSEWSDAFSAERRFPRHSMWRHAWIEGAHIVVDCVPEEIQNHLQDLKQDVAQSNLQYRNILQKQSEQAVREAAAKQSEKERIEKIRGGLKFD